MPINPKKIEQCDIFSDIVFIESISIVEDEAKISEVHFPLAMCASQSCDFESDLRDRSKEEDKAKGNMILQIIMIPLFPVAQFAEGSHWGDLIKCSAISSVTMKDMIKKNREARYHYIKFPDEDKLGPFVADFKHFFTISRDNLYSQMSKRICSIRSLYRDDIIRRFANYMSRIGLPE